VLLDHVLVSPALRSSAVDVVHAQSEFASRWTDRDPLVGYVKMAAAEPGEAPPPATP